MAHPPAPADTDSDVYRRQIDRWREMTPAQRAKVADLLSIDVATMAEAGIRHFQPDISDEEVARELLRRRHGRVLADAAWTRSDSAGAIRVHLSLATASA